MKGKEEMYNEIYTTLLAMVYENLKSQVSVLVSSTVAVYNSRDVVVARIK